MQTWHAAIWPDGTWAWRNEIDTYYTHMSDDYIRVAIPEWFGEEDLDFIAYRVAMGWTQHDIDLFIAREIDGPDAHLSPNWKPNQYE